MAKKVGVNVSISANIRKFSTQMQNMKRKLRRLGGDFQRFGRDMSRRATLPLAVAGGYAVKTFTEFEQSMAKVRAISGATNGEFKLLSENARELGRTTRYTASEVGELQLNLSKLGLTPSEINKSTASILDLALATGEDLADSARVAAGTMKAFSLQSSDMNHIADVMAKSFSSSALDLEKFDAAMRSVSKVSDLAGMKLENTTAVLSVLVNNQLDASTAGTSLRNILLELSSKGLSWKEAMDRINNSTNSLTVAKDLFGKRATAAAAIIATNRDEIDRLTKAYAASDGSARKMAAMMDNTLNGAFLRLRSAVEGVAIDLGGIMKPAIEKMTIIITGFADSFSKLSNSTKKTVIGIAAITAAIGPLMIGIGAAIKAIPLIAQGFAFLTSPIGLAIVALATLTAGFVAYKMSGMNALDYVAFRWKQSVNRSIKAIQTYLRAIGALTGALDIFIAAITGRKVQRNIFLEAAVGLERLTFDLPKPKSKMDDFMESIRKAKEEADRLVESLDKVVDFEGGDPEGLPKLFKGLAEGMNVGGGVGAAVVEKSIEKIESAVAKGATVGAAVGGMFKAEIDQMTQGFNNIAQLVNGTLINAFQTLGHEIGRALGQGGFKNGELGKALLDQLTAFAVQLGQQLVMIGSVLASIPGMQAAAVPYINGGLALIAGGSIAAGFSEARSGGTTTMGASATGVAANGQKIEVTGVIRGADLHLLYGDQTRRRR